MSGARVTQGRSRERDPAIDFARGVASLIMIQGHAFHAWVAPRFHDGLDYRLTRVLGTLPLPAFLVLCGAAVAYRLRHARERGEPGRALRAALAARGLTVVAAGYLVNLAYAALDGADSIATVLRADVLQVIGLSIVALSLCVGGGASPPAMSRVAARAAGLALAVSLVCPSLTRAALADAPGWPFWLRVVLAPFADVPGLTQMPLVPLFAWAAVGFIAGWLLIAGQPRRASGARLAAVAGVGLAAAVVGSLATALALDGAPLWRGHPAVVWNVLEYAGRGLFVLGISPLLVARLPASAQRVVARFGKASLWAYVFHIPLCYGRAGAVLRERLSVGEAAWFVLALAVASYGVVMLRLGGQLGLARQASSAWRAIDRLRPRRQYRTASQAAAVLRAQSEDKPTPR